MLTSRLYMTEIHGKAFDLRCRARAGLEPAKPARDAASSDFGHYIVGQKSHPTGESDTSSWSDTSSSIKWLSLLVTKCTVFDDVISRRHDVIYNCHVTPRAQIRYRPSIGPIFKSRDFNWVT